MLNAQQFRAAVKQFAPGERGPTANANTDWFGPIDRTGFGQEHNVAVSGAGRAWTTACRSTSSTSTGSSSGTAPGGSAWGRTTTSGSSSDRLNLRVNLRGSRADDRFTPLGVLSQRAQYGPTQPIIDPNTPTGFYDWTGGSTSADNPVAILNLAEEKAHDLPWHRQPAGRVQPAMGRGAPGQPQPRLRRDRGRTEELHPERRCTGSR